MTTYESIKEGYLTRIKLITISVAAIGIFMVLLSFKSIPGATSSLLSYLLLNLGGLFFFGGTYTLISELYLRKKYTEHMESMLLNTFNRITFCQNVFDYGIYDIIKVFSKEKLLERIKQSKNVKMIVIRNASFFDYYSPEIKDLIIKNGLILELFFLNPESKVLSIVSERFIDTGENALAAKMKDVASSNIKIRIFDELPKNLKGNLSLHYYDLYPAYSAYMFDNHELWFVPYFYRKEKRPVPVFIFNDQNKIESTEFYKDIISVLESSTKLDLNTLE